ncbi:hypothetical protein KDJ56_17490 [Brevibacillus composti]|uniref:Uncharacterized protein n=1 Tax=Brevibacillus composti TaxID=2796470 RepID=A0A7T5EJB6_9BACL|nr:DUF6143 family protein [Brevibacillus composti]QQE73671.1 hypothetical protein JD108_17550 [Brevibacillus composti]QUO40754.1 hypothetical protein KDJ56_17490 [Brevibacillus composti]
MAKHLFSQTPYFYGMTDMYMQMGYFPYPGQSLDEQADMTIGIPLAAAMAMQCKYYLGQTEPILAGNGTSSWAALVNPPRSGIHLFINEYVISNQSAEHTARVQLWFGKSSALGTPAVSPSVTSGFVQPSPCPLAQGQLVSDTGSLPEDGVVAATRLIPPRTSVAAEKTGHWILAPGTALLFFVPAEEEAAELIVSVGWWEQPIYR